MEHTVTREEDGLHLRAVLRGPMGVSYSAMKSAKWDGRILVNQQIRTVDTKVCAGDVVTFVPREAAAAYQLTPYALPLNIVYQDDYLMVIDKPAPLASQSSAGHPNDSLENALYAHLGCPEHFLYRPVNRLDKGTSGLMAVALDAHTQHRMQQRLHTEDFRRIYLAVVEGEPPMQRGTVDAPIDKVDEASVRRVVTASGKPSVTHYEVLKRAGGRSLVRLELETGRTHQIRVHMQYLGCPVFGDFLYGKESPLLPGRFALHSTEIWIRHPISDEMVHVVSPLPRELERLMEDGFSGA